MQFLIRAVLLFLLVSSNLWASKWYVLDAEDQPAVKVFLFLSSTCKYCEKEDAFFHKLEAQYPWLKVQRYVINKDRKALLKFNQFLTEQDRMDFSVPSAFFCTSRWVGFAGEDTTGKDLLHALTYCKQQIDTQGKITPVASKVLRSWANANRFDTGMVEQPSAAYYTLFMALIDASAPCAYFGFLVFCGMLFMQHNTSQRLIAGFLFIVALGIMHYFQQGYPNLAFTLVQWLRWPAVAIGLFSLYLAAYTHRKPSIFSLSLVLTVLLVFMVQSYQQNCVMNWSLIFEQGIHNKQLAHWQLIVYQTAYQLIYLSVLVLLLVGYTVLMKKKRFIPLQTRLSLVGQALVFMIGLILLFYPWALSYLMLSFGVAAIALLYAILMQKRSQGGENG